MEMGNNKHKNEGRATYLQHIFLAYKNNKPNETGEKIIIQITRNKRNNADKLFSHLQILLIKGK